MMAETAQQHKLVTQMGTQIHAGTNYRRAVELIHSGAIGPVRRRSRRLGADFWDPPCRPTHLNPTLRPTRRQFPPRSTRYSDRPDPPRPYHTAYAPFSWRYWWAFANGQLGDFFCHYCDLAFWALKLRHPTTVQATGPVHPESTAQWTIARQEYPARDGMPPVTLHWYHGGGYPALVKEQKIPTWGSAVLFVGSEGMLISDYDRHQLLPEDKYADFRRPDPFIADSIGHHLEWIEACKTAELSRPAISIIP